MKNVTKKLLLGLACVMVLAGTAAADPLEEMTKSEPLDGAESLDLSVELGLAEVDLRAGEEDVLVTFHALYNDRFVDPEFDVQRSGTKARVKIRSDDHGRKRERDIDDDQLYEVRISPNVDLFLDCDMGLAENRIDLTGLRVKEFILDAGLAETRITVDRPNALRTEVIEISSGLGEVETEYLGNLKFDRLEVDGGMGSVTLDLRGYEGRGKVSVDIGMGSATLILPENVGVQVEYEKSMMSSVNLDDFNKVARDLYESEGYEDKEHRLEIQLSVGMGSVDLRWRN